jgi:hypothetical protein
MPDAHAALSGAPVPKLPPSPLTPQELSARPVDVPGSASPALMVVVDTEEEFDWSAAFSREAVGVSHLRQIDRIQTIFDRYQLRPTYVIDFPVASQRDGVLPLKALLDDGKCAVGAHLHPWVTPPFTEAVTRENSFACNLGLSLERAKLTALKTEIEHNFAITPRVYKAGRYGFGRSTIPILEDLEFQVDQSVIPHADFTGESGPSFESFDEEPFFFGREQALLEVPCTCAYVGLAGVAAAPMYRFTSSPSVRWTRLTGICARLRIADKLMLSPEGFTLADLKHLTTALLNRGCRTFTFTFHSPSIEAGHTPYVQSARDLATFTATIESYLDFFFGALNGVATTPEEFRALQLARTNGKAPASNGLTP